MLESPASSVTWVRKAWTMPSSSAQLPGTRIQSLSEGRAPMAGGLKLWPVLPGNVTWEGCSLLGHCDLFCYFRTMALALPLSSDTVEAPQRQVGAALYRWAQRGQTAGLTKC